MKGAEIIVKVLQEQKVDTVFGYPGGTILSLLDALRNKRGIKLYTNCHEQFCTHAAEGYARATGKPGVVTATSGPGATNLVTGLANAYMDSTPMVAITGNVPLHLLGRDAFQEIDIYGVTMSITKHNFIVKSVESLADTLRSAFRIASSGRKGPVLVDIPKNIFDECAKYVPATPSEEVFPLPRGEELREAAELIDRSSRPVLCLGGGVIASNAAEKVYTFAKKLGTPVITTAMGIGSFPQDDEQYLGLVGLQPNPSTLQALRDCDLFIGAGLRFSERMLENLRLHSPHCKILHLDIDEAEIGKNLPAYSAVVGDLFAVLESLLPLVSAKAPRYYPDAVPRDPLYTQIFGAFPDAVYTTEVGAHQIKACHSLPIVKPRHFITSGGLGTMGFGLPAAIGAAIATGKRVVNLAGDGSFAMNLQELSTAVKYRLPITQVVFNNRRLGMICDLQDRDYEGRHILTETPAMDLPAMATAMGVPFVRSTEGEGLPAVLTEARKEKGVCFIEVLTDH
ncbi:MAG: acetolactate synthase large subunit [Clostridia bacterium]|nr:acetolactate synthase large subunit [Clostridia bacterium]